MKKLNYILALVLTIIISDLSAQNVLDGVYEKHHVKTRRVIPYSPLREADVMWSRRIWRQLDLNEKINLPMTYPNSMLTSVILDAISAGELTAYRDEEFKEILTPEAVAEFGSSVDTQYVMDPITFEEKIEVAITELDRDGDVRTYRIKEDWFFDKQRSVMEPRIIGIAPFYTKKNDDGLELLQLPICWIYYPELRYILANAEVFNRHNDAERMSYLDLFDKRMFSSYIIKRSNVYDRTIQDYAVGKDYIIESERIKNDMILYEHDLWHF